MSVLKWGYNMYRPIDMYGLRIRGKLYKVDPEGRINGYDNWRVFALVPRWNMRPYVEFQWPSIKKRLDSYEMIEGYLYDVDYGTLRFWGGRYGGKIPKAKMWKMWEE